MTQDLSNAGLNKERNPSRALIITSKIWKPIPALSVAFLRRILSPLGNWPEDSFAPQTLIRDANSGSTSGDYV